MEDAEVVEQGLDVGSFLVLELEVQLHSDLVFVAIDVGRYAVLVLPAHFENALLVLLRLQFLEVLDFNCDRLSVRFGLVLVVFLREVPANESGKRCFGQSI